MSQVEDKDISGATPNEDGTPVESEELSDQGVAGEGEEGKPEDVTDKRVRDAQEALRQKATELSEMKERVVKMEGMLEAMQGMQGQREDKQVEPENPFAFLDDAKLEEDINEDVGKNTLNVIRKTVSELHKTLIMRDRWLTQELQKRDQRLESLAPDRVQLREAIAELKKDPDYAQLDESVLALIAKKQKSKPAGRTVAEFPGSPGGSGRVRAAGSGGNSALKAAVDARFKKLYPEFAESE